MNRFSDELRIISPVAWAIALLAGSGLCLLLMFVAIPSDHQLSHWPLIGKICFSGGLGLVLTALILLVGYINADARRRGMRYVMWTLLALFLPNSLGIILYFVLRDPLPVRCGKCGAPVQPPLLSARNAEQSCHEPAPRVSGPSGPAGNAARIAEAH